ncbi:MAG: carboxylating nicotinate-nucleotide diphosphorylase [Syntrophomonadaceae bacterium]
MTFWQLDELVRTALQEDIGHADITTASLIPKEQYAKGIFIAKDSGIIAGLEVCERVFKNLDNQVEFRSNIDDGDQVDCGSEIAVVKGPTRVLLTGERVALNFLQRLSGIATKTRSLVETIKYYKAELVDTRKTTPGLRYLEKYAVNVGGARNHRFGLYDGILIKDNHIKAVGSIQKAVSTVRQRVPHTFKIEIEVENLDQLEEAIEARADIILLDNMDLETLKNAVDLAQGQAFLEASGGINECNILEVAKTGVDFISMGALTHSVKSLDISFKIKETY